MGEALEAFFVVVLAIVAIVLFVLFVVPVLIALVEVVLLLLLVLAGVAARVALRRPWIVDARVRGDVGVPLSWKVVGWRRSGEVIRRWPPSWQRVRASSRPETQNPADFCSLSRA